MKTSCSEYVLKKLDLLSVIITICSFCVTMRTFSRFDYEVHTLIKLPLVLLLSLFFNMILIYYCVKSIRNRFKIVFTILLYPSMAMLSVNREFMQLSFYVHAWLALNIWIESFCKILTKKANLSGSYQQLKLFKQNVLNFNNVDIFTSLFTIISYFVGVIVLSRVTSAYPPWKSILNGLIMSTTLHLGLFICCFKSHRSEFRVTYTIWMVLSCLGGVFILGGHFYGSWLVPILFHTRVILKIWTGDNYDFTYWISRWSKE